MSLIALVIGIASLGLAAVHVVAGGRQVARPMRGAAFGVVARDTMYACWHIVTAQLVLSGLYLTAAAFAPTTATDTGVRAVATSYLAYAAVFLWIAAASRRRGALLQLGQWIAFLPLGAVGWLGTL
jgi:hypothetical protein